ncbi:hypothetical protein BDZ89DRAFT_1138936 [Hymenopellis radicata]|nr:hypothetical protein BDZ89DRAFT_1138936 [Hymenopellis radicata]
MSSYYCHGYRRRIRRISGQRLSSPDKIPTPKPHLCTRCLVAVGGVDLPLGVQAVENGLVPGLGEDSRPVAADGQKNFKKKRKKSRKETYSSYIYKASLSALPGIVDLRLSFGAEPLKGRLIECLSDRTVVPNLRVLIITTTTISRAIWEAELKDTLIRVLSARYQSPEESSTGTDIHEVVVVLGRETYMQPGGPNKGSVYFTEGYSSWRDDIKDERLLSEDLGRDCTIEELVDADFVEFRKLKERGLDIRLSIWKGRTLLRYV